MTQARLASDAGYEKAKVYYFGSNCFAISWRGSYLKLFFTHDPEAVLKALRRKNRGVIQFQEHFKTLRVQSGSNSLQVFSMSPTPIEPCRTIDNLYWGSYE